MPDLATHLAVAYLAAETKRSISRETKTLFLVGNLLPDLLTRSFYAVLPESYWFFAPLHTPLGLVLVCSIASYAFEERLHGVAFRSLVLGAGLHLLLDALQKRVVDVYGIFFPFAWRDVYIGLFWPGESRYGLPVLITVILIIALIKRRCSKPVL